MGGLDFFLMAAAKILLVGHQAQIGFFELCFQFGGALLQLFVGRRHGFLVFGSVFRIFGSLVLFGHFVAFFEWVIEFHDLP